MIQSQDNLKDVAKELYFKDVTVKEYRDNFLKELANREVVDKRSQGYCCSYCGNITQKEIAFSEKNRTIFPKYSKNELWIVNSHYDGCRGWD